MTAEQLETEDIESAHTLEEVAKGFGTELPALLEYLSLPAFVPGSTKIRDLEDIDEHVTTKTIRNKMEGFI